MEIWKDIPNYEGLYQVSNLGNVRSLKEAEEKTSVKTKNISACLVGRTKTAGGYIWNYKESE